MDRIFTVTFPGLSVTYDDRCGSRSETHSPVEGAILNRELPYCNFSADCLESMCVGTLSGNGGIRLAQAFGQMKEVQGNGHSLESDRADAK